MKAASVLAAMKDKQAAFYVLRMLQLTGYLFPPQALLRDGDHFDYIVIGGGSTGCVIATRLAQHKYNVLLIEGGPDSPFETTLPSLVTYLKNSSSDWNMTSVNQQYNFQIQRSKSWRLTQGLMLGGTSALNYMIYSRGNPENFEEWYDITGDPNWKWNNVLPYFIKSESVHDNEINNSYLKYYYGSKGYIDVTRVDKPETADYLKGFQQIGKDIIADNDGNRIGYAKGLVTAYDNTRQASGTQYLQNVTDNDYIAVAKLTLATKIIWDEFNNAVGVEVITDDKRKVTVYAREEIILSAGAIKSPQLLLLSGIGPKEDLKKFNISCVSDVPVGRNLQDHIALPIPHKTNKKPDGGDSNPGKYPSGLFVGFASLNESHIHHHTKFPDYQVMGLIINDKRFLLQFCVSTLGYPNDICNKLNEEAKGNQLLVTLVSNMYSYSRGEVRLASTDPKVQPQIILNSFSNDRDLDAFVKYVKDYLEVEQSDAFKSMGATRIDLASPKCDVFEKDSREYWRCNILTLMISLGHYGGTCAMGSVVDSRLRVLGVNRLRVADASIMPTLVTGTTYPATLMIGEKAADIIIEDAGAYNLVQHEKIQMSQIRNMPILYK